MAGSGDAHYRHELEQSMPTRSSQPTQKRTHEQTFTKHTQMEGSTGQLDIESEI